MRNFNFMRRIFLLLLLFVAFENAKAQTVVVNPDGTHSIVIDNGSTKTIVNPNGTHSTVIVSSPKNGQFKIRQIINFKQSKQSYEKNKNHREPNCKDFKRV